MSLPLAVTLGVLRELNGALQAANYHAEPALASLAVDSSSCNLHIYLLSNHNLKRRVSVPAVTLETPGDTVASEEQGLGERGITSESRKGYCSCCPSQQTAVKTSKFHR